MPNNTTGWETIDPAEMKKWKKLPETPPAASDNGWEPVSDPQEVEAWQKIGGDPAPAVPTSDATPAPIAPSEAPAAPDMSQAKPPEEKGWLSRTWDAVKGVGKEAWDMVAPGVDNVVNTVSPMTVPISDHGTIRDALEHPKDDLPMQVYELVGKLADTRQTMLNDPEKGKADYEANLRRLMVDKLGYQAIAEDTDTGEYIAIDKDGQEHPINKDTMKTILAQTFGDKYEIAGALAGAKTGYELSRAIPSPWIKAGATALGSAIGAGTGSIGDMVSNAFDTGQKLTPAQAAEEINKAMAIDAAGSVAGPVVGKTVMGTIKAAKAVMKSPAAARRLVDLAKRFDVEGYLQGRFVDDMAKLPEADQQRYLDALEFAAENNIRLTTTSVIDHPQADQFVQVIARNPFIRQRVKGLEADARNNLLSSIFHTLEEAGPKATPEELDPLIKQEVTAALERRNKQVRGLYDEFEHKAGDEVVTRGKVLSDTLHDLGDKYGYRETDGTILDEGVAKAEQIVKRMIEPRAAGGKLDVKTLDKIAQGLGKRAQANKVSNPMLHAYFTEAKAAVDNEINRLSEYMGDDVAQALAKARKAYREKATIYGQRGEYSDIRNLIDSPKPNEAIHRLLSGEKALDNARMLVKELSGRPEGEALIGALGRKHLDDVFATIDLRSPSAIARALQSDRMRTAKVLLGKERAKQLDNIATLMEMMGRTEKLLAGAGSEIATSKSEGIPAFVAGLAKKFLIRMQQDRLVGKVFDNTIAQKMLYKTLKSVTEARTPLEAKAAEHYLRQTAREVQKVTDTDMSDIWDKRKARAARVAEAKQAQAEKKAIEAEAAAWQVPDDTELEAVGKVANNDDAVLLNQAIGRIKQGKQSPADVARYIAARKSIPDEALATAVEKEHVSRLPARYREEDIPAAVDKITTLRDYLMSHPDLKYGNEWTPRSVNALVHDLQTQGYPRSKAHDQLYRDMQEMYDALEPRIKEAYPDATAPKPPAVGHGSEAVPLEKVDPTMLFGEGLDNLIAGGVAGITEDENGDIVIDPQRFVMGLGGYTVAKALLKSPMVRAEVRDALGQALEKFDNSVYGAQPKIFAGEHATGWDEAAGKFADTADKKGRFWIDDSGAKINEDIFNGAGLERLIKADSTSQHTGTQTAMGLDEILDHEELFTQYPELRDVNVFFDKSETANGQYNRATNSIHINSDLIHEAMWGDDKAKSTLLHEIQHAIQAKEGFARGGSLDSGVLREVVLEATKKKYKADIARVTSDGEDIYEKAHLWDEYIKKKAGEDYGDMSIYDAYTRLAGEQEARAVQAKLKHPEMTPYEALMAEEGKIDAPIVRYGDGVMRSDGASEYEKMLVHHNLTADNIHHADKMGGLAVPSIAITKESEPLLEYGDITLIGDKNMVSPARNVKVYGADIYSPRYPEVQYRVSSRTTKSINDDLRPYAEMVGMGRSYVEPTSVRDLTGHIPLVAKFLESRGIKPKIIVSKPNAKEVRQTRKYFAKWLDQDATTRNLANDPEFQKKAADELREIDPERYKKIFESENKDRMTSMYYRRREDDLRKLRRQIENKGEVDLQATTAAIQRQLQRGKLPGDLEEYAHEYLKTHGTEEVIYHGVDSRGRHRYVPHTLDNVIKKLKKDLGGGENFSYGVGKVRAHYTPQFRTIQQIQKNRNRLVSKEEFEKAKTEVGDAHDQIVENLRPHYEDQREAQRFGFADTVADMLSDAASQGIDRALRSYGFRDVPAATRTSIEALMSALRDMPTEYFEANIIRAVDLGEFKVAIVPKGTPKRTTDLLRKKGLKIKRYDAGDEAARKKAIREAAHKNDVLFVHPASVAVAIGAASETAKENKGSK